MARLLPIFFLPLILACCDSKAARPGDPANAASDSAWYSAWISEADGETFHCELSLGPGKTETVSISTDHPLVVGFVVEKGYELSKDPGSIFMGTEEAPHKAAGSPGTWQLFEPKDRTVTVLFENTSAVTTKLAIYTKQDVENAKHQNQMQEEIVGWAAKSIDWEDQSDGVRRVSFATPYFYGDKIQFDSVNGKGIGFIDGIVLAQDGSVYYTVQDAVVTQAGQHVIHGGIYPDEITLIERGIQGAESVVTREPAAGNPTGPPLFTKLADFLQWADTLLAADNYDALADAQTDGPDKRETTLASIKELDAFVGERKLATIFEGRSFPEKETTFKLGGHMKELHCFHIDFIKQEGQWALSRIWQCR